uniref:Uncharacterized protein n=1 Tax=Cucumis melo TaxID=3656 RepID=A0A9I9EFZ7_CUCME
MFGGSEEEGNPFQPPQTWPTKSRFQHLAFGHSSPTVRHEHSSLVVHHRHSSQLSTIPQLTKNVTDISILLSGNSEFGSELQEALMQKDIVGKFRCLLSLYSLGQVFSVPVNGVAPTTKNNSQSTASVSSATPLQSEEYDFSSLTQDSPDAHSAVGKNIGSSMLASIFAMCKRDNIENALLLMPYMSMDDVCRQ